MPLRGLIGCEEDTTSGLRVVVETQFKRGRAVVAIQSPIRQTRVEIA